MKRKGKILGIVLCTVLMMSTVQVHAKKSKNYWPKQSDKIEAGAAILMDVDTGTILYKKNINEQYYPASITKILTTLVAIENSSMDEVVTFSRDAIYKTIYEVDRSSSIWRDIGEKMTMEQCLYAVMLESANECAYAVAEHVGGTVKDFVKMMNDKAKSLGCKSSHFMNPHGLPDEKHYLTAKDMARIAKAAYENETFRLICGTKRYTIPPTNKHAEPTYLVNHHKMLYPKDTAAYLYDYCTGGKTGYTNAAGNTLVTFAQKDGMTLLTVILNGSSPQYWNETRSLLEFGFENFNLCNVSEHFEEDESYEEEKYDTLNTNDPYAHIDPQAKIILPKSVKFSKAAMEINYENLPANALAQLKYTYGKHEVGTADIIRTNTFIDKNGTQEEQGENDLSGTEITKTDEEHTDTNTEKNEIDNQNSDSGSDRKSEDTSKNTSGDLKDSAQNQTDVKNGPESQNKDEKDNGSENDKDNKEKSGFFDKIKNINLIERIKNFDAADFFGNMKDTAVNFFANIKDRLSIQTVIITIGILLGIVLIIVFKVSYEKSYVIRQKIANYKNRKRARRQYTIIRDTRKSRRKRRR